MGACIQSVRHCLGLQPANPEAVTANRETLLGRVPLDWTGTTPNVNSPSLPPVHPVPVRRKVPRQEPPSTITPSSTPELGIFTLLPWRRCSLTPWVIRPDCLTPPLGGVAVHLPLACVWVLRLFIHFWFCWSYPPPPPLSPTLHISGPKPHRSVPTLTAEQVEVRQKGCSTLDDSDVFLTLARACKPRSPGSSIPSTLSWQLSVAEGPSRKFTLYNPAAGNLPPAIVAIGNAVVRLDLSLVSVYSRQTICASGPTESPISGSSRDMSRPFDVDPADDIFPVKGPNFGSGILCRIPSVLLRFLLASCGSSVYSTIPVAAAETLCILTSRHNVCGVNGSFGLAPAAPKSAASPGTPDTAGSVHLCYYLVEASALVSYQLGAQTFRLNLQTASAAGKQQLRILTKSLRILRFVKLWDPRCGRSKCTSRYYCSYSSPCMYFSFDQTTQDARACFTRAIGATHLTLRLSLLRSQNLVFLFRAPQLP